MRVQTTISTEARTGQGLVSAVTLSVARIESMQNRIAPTMQSTTLSGGSLGSHVDEERSQLRYAM